MRRHEVQVSRAYDAPASSASARVLVGRIWARGLSKQRAHLDEWCKQIAPSTALRRWYGHDPQRFEEFRTPLPLTATKQADISAAAVLVELPRS